MKTYYLIDYENVGCEGLSGCERLSKTDFIHLFYTDNSRKIDLDIINNHGEAKLITHKVPTGKQSADIHLSSYLGYLLGTECAALEYAAQEDTDEKYTNEKHTNEEHTNQNHIDWDYTTREKYKFVIISKDTGFDHIIQFWRDEKKAEISRREKISGKQSAQKIIDIDTSAKKSQQVRQQIASTLHNAGMSKEVVNYVSCLIEQNAGEEKRKQEIHNAVVSKYGNEKGREIYRSIKNRI